MWGIARSGRSKLFFFILSMKRIKCGIVKEAGSIFNTPAYCISRFCLCGSRLFFQAGDCVLKMFPHTQDICLPLVCLTNHQNVWTSWVDTCSKFIQRWTRDKLSSEGIWKGGGGGRTENCFFFFAREELKMTLFNNLFSWDYNPVGDPFIPKGNCGVFVLKEKPGRYIRRNYGRKLTAGQGFWFFFKKKPCQALWTEPCGCKWKTMLLKDKRMNS